MSNNLKVYSMFSASLLASSSVSLLMGVWVVVKDYAIVIEWEVWGLSSCLVSMSLVLDWMSFIFLGSVCLISGCIMKYSEYYMEGEFNYTRFVFIMLVFVMSMGLLVISPNLISLLLGWDGLGLSSYLLVVFYQSETSCNAGMLTVLSNRIGDVAILLSIALMLSSGSWDFYGAELNYEMVLVLLVMLACSTKSAQMPFSAWLPAAMAAPTPVSALVHSSTLVTAGVYVLIRFNEAIMMSGLSPILLVASSVTMIMAGMGAMFESDMKKVIALSTLSQLGLMIMILSVGMKELAFFHLITHAMFKSTLFMCAGFMIHGAQGSQDSRVMSGFVVSSPFLSVVLSTSNLALCGFPFLAGFYSKDAVLEYMFSSSLNTVVMLMAIVGTGLTVSYSLRLLVLVSSAVSAMSSVTSVSDMSVSAMKSVCLLFSASLLMGFCMYWSVMPVLGLVNLTSVGKFLVGVASLTGGLCVFKLLEGKADFKKGVVKLMESLFSTMWFMPFLSTKMISLFWMNSGHNMTKMVDSGWLEFYGPSSAQRQVKSSLIYIQKSQASFVVSSYVVVMLLGMVGLLIMM